MRGRFTNAIATVSTIAAISLLGAPWGADAKIRGSGEEFDKRAQTTIGGSEYFVQGKITSMDDNYYWVMQPSGDEIRLKVTEATNMFCPTRERAEQKGQTDAGFEPATTPAKQGISKGFRIGDCPFRVGDYVKAQTTDVGTASFIRVANARGHQEGTPSDLPAQLGMPSHYMWLPVPLGGLAASDADKRMVVSGDGHKLGYLERVIIDTRSGKTDFGIVKLENNGRLIALPWEAFRWVKTEKLVNIPERERRTAGESVMQLIPSKAQMADIPTFSFETLSMAKIREYWEGEVIHPEMADVTSYAAPWVKDVVQELNQRSSFRQALENDRYLPAKLSLYLNDAAKDLKQGKRFEAREHFRRALFKLQEGVESHVLSQSTAEKIRSAVILHAPQQLVAAIESPQQDKAIALTEAISIARDHSPGEVIDAEYMGKYGKNAYRVAIMEGTGVTHAIQVDAGTGEVIKDVPVPGHPMPNEPLR